MHTKLERLLSKSLTALEVMTYYLVVHTGPAGADVLPGGACQGCSNALHRLDLEEQAEVLKTRLAVLLILQLGRVIIAIVMIVLKGAVRDFSTTSSLRTASLA